MPPRSLPLHPVPFFFVRHGESVWNAARRVQGQSDVPLSAIGLAQAHEAAGRIAGQPVGAIFASPLQRARRTAEIINGTLGLPISFHAAGSFSLTFFGGGSFIAASASAP